MQDVHVDNREELHIDLSKLSESDLEVLARLVVRKLRYLMQQERDRTGR